MQILQPNLHFEISAASRALSETKPVNNLEILRNFPRTADKSQAFLNKFAEKTGEKYGISGFGKWWITFNAFRRIIIMNFLREAKPLYIKGPFSALPQL